MKEKSKNILKEGGINLSKVIITASAGLLSGNPIVGTGIATILTETFFGIRGKLKLKRTENFIIEFSKYIKKINPNLDIDQIDSEDFGDFFEQVLIKVSQTNSKNKLLAYKKLTTNQIIEPISYDLVHSYLDLLYNLNDNHLIIIRHWYFEESQYQALLNEFQSKRDLVKKQFDSGINKINNNESYSDYSTRLIDYEKIDKENIRESIKIKRIKLVESFGINEYDFWLFDLVRFGILSQSGALTNNYQGERSFNHLQFSAYGKKVVEYIFKEI